MTDSTRATAARLPTGAGVARTVAARAAVVCGLLLAGAGAAVTSAPAAAAAELKKKAAKAETAADDTIWWSNAVVVEPGAVTLGTDSAPAVEFQVPLSRERKHAHSLAVVYSGRSYNTSNDNYDSATADEVKHHADKLSIQALVGRYMLYLTPSFHFNFGAGVRQISTQEHAELANGNAFDLKKSATSLGADIGLGNRWVLDNGLILGGTWIQFFVPVALLASKDATVPAGYTAGSCVYAGCSPGDGRRADGMTGSLRIAADVGYAW